MKSEINWSKLINWFLNKPKSTGFIVFISLSIVFSYISLQQYHIEKQNKKDEMDNTLKVLGQNIEQSLKNCYTTTLTLALTINDDGIPENFNSIGKRLIESNNNIEAVQLVPNGIIRFIYPMQGNEAAIGLNIFKSKYLKKEALKSILNQKMYFAGPLELKQGGQGIVGRLPVYLKNKFWGFSAVIIKLDKLLKTSGINAIDKTKYHFQISKKDPITQKDIYFLPQKIKFPESNFVTITIPDGGWKLYLIDTKTTSLKTSLIVSTILSVILALIFGFLTTLFLKKPAELQVLVEQQATNLINSEIKFKTIFDQAAIGIANIDPKTGKFLEINNQFCKLLGYTQKEMKEKNYQSITHPDDLKKDVLTIKKINEGTIRDYTTEKKCITKNGEDIWVNLSVTPLWGKNEKPTSTIAIIEDITQKKVAEALIKQSQIRFKSLFDDSPLPLWEQDYSKVLNYLKELNLVDETKENIASYINKHPEVLQKCFSLINIIDVNNQCLDQYAPKTKLELLNNLDVVFSDETIPSFTKHIIAICRREHNLKMDAKIKTPKGEIRDIHFVFSVMKGYENTLERVIVSTEDITKRKKQEKIILNSQIRIESLINTIDGIVWECDAQTFEFTFISKKVENILGYTTEEWLSSPTFWAEHIYTEDKQEVLKYCSEQTNEILDHDFEYRMIAKNGNIIWLRDIVNVISKNNKAVSLRGIMIDITKTKEIQNDLNNSFNLVSEQNKRLLNFSYIVSHNLRSHTSNITSLTGLIETAESDEEREQMVQLLKTVSNSLNETLFNLNEVVNIQTNIGLVSEKINLKKYIDNTLNILAEQIKVKGAHIISNISDDIEINYNPAYLESILFNIISNAIRYSHKDREPQILINFLKENNLKVIEISDNGIGIDLERNGNKIFGMYKTFSDNPNSKGIGLFITKNQIEAMGGSITIESKPGIGTTFKIYIA
tara:strand:+ start:44317 stop:47160 length:2844 start_codon:yes stop_codon:yes gene_type:complete